LLLRYDVLVDVVENDGFNPGIFDAAISSAVHEERALTEEEQVEALFKNGKAFSASYQWNNCESRIGKEAASIE
jgi:hypothetical protein